MSKYLKDLKTERQWRSATGYNKERFANLLNLFEREYFRIFGKTLSDRRSDSPKESVVETEEDLLFLTLLGLKSNLTHDLLGLMVGMDGSSAFRNKDLGISVLKSMLCHRGFAPARTFESVEEFEEYFQKYDTLIIDGEEQSIQRPSEEDSQKENYSDGPPLRQKKRHTLKTTIITGISGSESNKKILYLSYCYVGKTHDYRMLKEDFPLRMTGSRTSMYA